MRREGRPARNEMPGNVRQEFSVSIGSPLLKIDRTARTTTGQILEWSVRCVQLGTARYVSKIE